MVRLPFDPIVGSVGSTLCGDNGAPTYGPSPFLGFGTSVTSAATTRIRTQQLRYTTASLYSLSANRITVKKFTSSQDSYTYAIGTFDQPVKVHPLHSSSHTRHVLRSLVISAMFWAVSWGPLPSPDRTTEPLPRHLALPFRLICVEFIPGN